MPRTFYTVSIKEFCVWWLLAWSVAISNLCTPISRWKTWTRYWPRTSIEITKNGVVKWGMQSVHVHIGSMLRDLAKSNGANSLNLVQSIKLLWWSPCFFGLAISWHDILGPWWVGLPGCIAYMGLQNSSTCSTSMGLSSNQKQPGKLWNMGDQDWHSIRSWSAWTVPELMRGGFSNSSQNATVFSRWPFTSKTPIGIQGLWVMFIQHIFILLKYPSNPKIMFSVGTLKYHHNFMIFKLQHGQPFQFFWKHTPSKIWGLTDSQVRTLLSRWRPDERDWSDCVKNTSQYHGSRHPGQIPLLTGAVYLRSRTSMVPADETPTADVQWKSGECNSSAEIQGFGATNFFFVKNMDGSEKQFS